MELKRIRETDPDCLVKKTVSTSLDVAHELKRPWSLGATKAKLFLATFVFLFYLANSFGHLNQFAVDSHSITDAVQSVSMQEWNGRLNSTLDALHQTGNVSVFLQSPGIFHLTKWVPL
jgi:hypothetical protein